MADRTVHSELPRVLVFSEGVLSKSHGTGTIFARNFAAYPRDLLANWFIGGSDDPLFPEALNLTPWRWPRSLAWPLATLPAKLWNRANLTPVWTVPVDTRAIRDVARRQPFQPDLVYAIVISRAGIDTLQGILQGLPARVRVILQIQDFFPSGQLGFMRALRRIAPRIAEVWAVSRSILATVSAHLPGIPQRFDPLCYVDLPSIWRTHHRPFADDFRCIILGNFWAPALLQDVRSIWAELQRRLPGLPPVRWHCHPVGVQRVRDAGFETGKEVQLAPFLSGEALWRELQQADLALVPFGREQQATSDYERYSMPSRLTELCPAGLPIFCLTGGNTPLHDYVTDHGIAKCSPAGDTLRTARALEALMLDAGTRRTLGRAARQHAEAHFRLDVFQAWLALALRRIAARE